MKKQNWSLINQGSILYRCSPETRERIKESCKKHDISQKAFMNNAVKAYMKLLDKEQEDESRKLRGH